MKTGPMKILALDTATEACSAALLVDEQVTEEYIELERGHAERVLPMVDALLREAGLRLTDLDAIAVGRGPGGFTGVRLGVGIAQGLAYGAGTRLVGISNLAAVALQAFDLHAGLERVLVCNDARMKEVYTGLFERSAGLVDLCGAESVRPPAAVSLEAPAHDDVAPLTGGAGRGFRAYPDLRARLDRALHVVEPDLLPRAGAIARLAAHAVRGGEAVEPEQLIPVYLRDDVARPATRLS